jgi:rhodanese-related sulfurtransferase
MNKLLLLIFAISVSSICNAQYKNDNVLFKTVYTQDLCDELAKNPGYLILDVRSKGEYEDTSSMGMNIGRFKDAKNINVRELGQHISELQAYKDQPVFVYCSHSQRSRRASKMLADSGFTKVYNINGGMTGLLQLPETSYACLYKQLTTKNNYTMLSAAEFCNKLSGNNRSAYLLDVRDDSSYNHISTDAKSNAIGIFNGSVHYSIEDINAGKAKIPKDKEIIITDIYGDDAVKAADMLVKNNYSKVSVLLEGIDRILQVNNSDLSCMGSSYKSPVKYNIVSAQLLQGWMKNNKDYVFLDVRSKDEYENKSKNYWQNLGHIQNAISMPTADLSTQSAAIDQYKNKPVIVYAFSSSTTAYDAANTLISIGFKNVTVLQGGLFNIGWTAANIKGYSSLATLRVDIPADNL